MSNFLRDLALAHQQREGYRPGTLAYINNNPGNIRSPNGSFIHFPSYEAGFGALEGDLKAKIFGTANSIHRYMAGIGKTYDQLVFQDYVSIYAPSADHNDPIAYCDFLCERLKQYNVHPQTPLSFLASLVKGEIIRIPDPPPEMTLEQRLASAQNALKFKISPDRASMLLRLIARLKEHLA